MTKLHEKSVLINGVACTDLAIDPSSVAITNGRANFGVRPNFVHGLDALSLLEELRSTSGKSLFIFGDSRTSNPNEWMVKRWSSIPLGGMSLSLNSGMNAAIYSQVVTAQVPNVYQAGPGCGWSCVGTCIQAVTQPEQTIWWNRTTYGSLGNVLASELGWPSNDLNCSQEFATDADGIEANALALLVYVGPGAVGDSAKSAYFNTYSETPGRKVVSVAISKALPWTNQLGFNLTFSGAIATVVGESFKQSDGPWIEYADGTKMTLHSLAIGGDKIGDNLNNGINEIGYNLGPNQFPEERLGSFIRTRSTRRPWFLVDLGTNGTIPYSSAEIHASRMCRLIEKLRRCANDSSAPVILRTAYPGNGDGASRYNQLAAIQVANRVRNVVCIDTFSAAAAGGGYVSAVAKGWFGPNPDGVHRSSDGRFAFEAMFNAIVSGNPWTHSAVLG